MAVIDTEYDGVWEQLYSKRLTLSERRAELEGELRDVSAQINHLNGILEHLGPLAGIGGGANIVSMGLTDAIRYILSNEEGRLSPGEIREKLAEKNYDLTSLTAPMASIYKILSRLASDGKPEVFRQKDEDGKVYYMWIRLPDEPPF